MCVGVCQVLDATFDDVLPLAVARMPPSWGSLVRLTCRRHLDLNNARLLRHYPGPVLLVRRAQDEVITVTSVGRGGMGKGVPKGVCVPGGSRVSRLGLV